MGVLLVQRVKINSRAPVVPCCICLSAGLESTGMQSADKILRGRQNVRCGRKQRPLAVQELLGKVSDLFPVFLWYPLIGSKI